MASVNDKCRQRFVSILCRYPYVILDRADDPEESDESIAIAKKARLKWEIAALKRKGGYNVRENNLFYPGHIEKEGEEEDEAVPNESYRYSLTHSPVDIAEYNDTEMCKIHSFGYKAGFADTVNNLSSTILKSVAEYKQKFTFDELFKAAGAKTIVSAEEVFIVHQDIALIESALKEKKLMTWGDLCFENPVSCKACRISLPLSDSSTIEFLIHLADTFGSERLKQYIDCVIEQASLVYTGLGYPFIRKMYKDVSIMEQGVLESAFESSNTQPTKTSTTVGSSTT